MDYSHITNVFGNIQYMDANTKNKLIDYLIDTCNELEIKNAQLAERARKFQSEKDRNANKIKEMNKLQEITAEFNSDLQQSLTEAHDATYAELQILKFDFNEQKEELENVKKRFKDSLKRKFNDQDEGLLAENMALKESIKSGGKKPCLECIICKDNKLLDQFVSFSPCGHMLCQNVSQK